MKAKCETCDAITDVDELVCCAACGFDMCSDCMVGSRCHDCTDVEGEETYP